MTTPHMIIINAEDIILPPCYAACAWVIWMLVQVCRDIRISNQEHRAMMLKYYDSDGKLKRA